MRRVKSKNIKGRAVKSMRCVNSNPKKSKWGQYAPAGGCDEIVYNVDKETTSALCWKCTSRSVSRTGKIHLME